MRRVLAVTALLLATSSATSAPARGSMPAGIGSDPVTVRLDRSAIDTSLGGRIELTSTVRNATRQPMSGLIAHLNVFSTDPGTYVDPEDWSSHRTQFPAAVPAHGSVALTWPVQAVNSGRLVVYVAVTDVQQHRVTVSMPLELTVSKRQTVDPGGVLPLAVGVPGAVAVVLGLVLLRRRRTA